MVTVLQRLLSLFFSTFVRHPEYFVAVAITSLGIAILSAFIGRARNTPISKSLVLSTTLASVIWLLGAINEQRMMGFGGNPIRVDLLFILGFGWLAILFQIAMTAHWILKCSRAGKHLRSYSDGPLPLRSLDCHYSVRS